MCHNVPVMKWILLSASPDNPEIKLIQTKLSSLHVECAVLVATSKDFFSDPARFFAELKPATHCIFLDSGKGFEDPSISFILGFLIGRAVPLFLCGSCTIFAEKQLPSQICCYASADQMILEIAKQLPRFAAEEKRRLAYNKLFSTGIPFTPDSFASHIAKDDAPVCQLFRDAGMSLNSRDGTGTPMLCVAARKDRQSMVQWLIDNGADINAVSEDRGYSPTMDAVWRSNTEITKLLVEHGANLNFISKEGQSVLVLAVGNGNAEICSLLIEHGADPNVKDQMGMSAREYASLFKKPAVLSAFEKYTVAK